MSKGKKKREKPKSRLLTLGYQREGGGGYVKYVMWIEEYISLDEKKKKRNERNGKGKIKSYLTTQMEITYLLKKKKKKGKPCLHKHGWTWRTL